MSSNSEWLVLVCRLASVRLSETAVGYSSSPSRESVIGSALGGRKPRIAEMCAAYPSGVRVTRPNLIRLFRSRVTVRLVLLAYAEASLGEIVVMSGLGTGSPVADISHLQMLAEPLLRKTARRRLSTGYMVANPHSTVIVRIDESPLHDHAPTGAVSASR